MRVSMVILALVATPLVTEVSLAQGKATKPASTDSQCMMPGLRKGSPMIDKLLTHFDKSCNTPASPKPAPAPTKKVPVPTPEPTPAPDQSTTDGAPVIGTVFVDNDASEMPNDGEPRLAGWTVELIANGMVKKSLTTDTNGVFSFSGVPVGSYLLCVTPKAGFDQWSPVYGVAGCPSGRGYSVNVLAEAPNSPWLDMNFGYFDLNG